MKYKQCDSKDGLSGICTHRYNRHEVQNVTVVHSCFYYTKWEVRPSNNNTRQNRPSLIAEGHVLALNIDNIYMYALYIICIVALIRVETFSLFTIPEVS